MGAGEGVSFVESDTAIDTGGSAVAQTSPSDEVTIHHTREGVDSVGEFLVVGADRGVDIGIWRRQDKWSLAVECKYESRIHVRENSRVTSFETPTVGKRRRIR